MVKLKVNPKTIKKFLYISLVFITVFWLIIFISNIWAGQSTKTNAANNAVVVSINNGLQNLPRPNIIEPGQTSGNANQVIASYLSGQNQLDETKLEGANIFTHGLKAFSINSLNNKAYAEFNKISSNLYATTNLLTASQKFLEYNPQADLAPLQQNPNAEGDTERLDRTTLGISKVLEEVKATGHPKSGEIETVLNPVLASSKDIDIKNLDQWYKEVKTAQVTIVKIINDDFTNYTTEHTKNLNEIAVSFLK